MDLNKRVVLWQVITLIAIVLIIVLAVGTNAQDRDLLKQAGHINGLSQTVIAQKMEIKVLKAKLVSVSKLLETALAEIAKPVIPAVPLQEETVK